MSDGFKKLAGSLIMESEKVPRIRLAFPNRGFRSPSRQPRATGTSRSQLRLVSHLLKERMTKRKKSLVVGRQIIKQFSLPVGSRDIASDSSSWGRAVTSRELSSETTRPITEAVSRTCLAVSSRWSIRADTTVCTVAGSGIVSIPRFSRYAPRTPSKSPLSAIVLTSSSRKKGLPCARSIMFRLSNASEGSSPKCSRTAAGLLRREGWHDDSPNAIVA